MCGINGVISNSNITEDNVKFIKQFNESIKHRGPDNSDIYSDEKVALGHVRLSIVDLNESSNQPMLSQNERQVLVFNGEIYNHEELREELKDGYKFSTDHSDTEVILAAYNAWGISCLNRFIGMFAFSLFDKDEDKLYLVRDRLGKKPLYYTKVEEDIYFSSENKAFFDSSLIDKQVNEEAIYHYLTFLTVPAPMTFYTDVKKVEAGHYIEISNGAINNIKYWDVSDYLNVESKDSYTKAVDKSKLLLEKSMHHRNVADVPISIALSGGLDSSLNLSYTKDIRSDELRAINISYVETSDFDESKIAERFSKETNIPYSSNPITESTFISWLDEYLERCTDVPAGDPNTSLLYGICKISNAEKYKVLLVGEGGDELGGYPIYKKLQLLDKLNRFIPTSVFKCLNILPLPISIKGKLYRLSNTPPIAQRFIFGFTEETKKKFWRGDGCYDSYQELEKLSAEITIKTKDTFLRKLINIEYKLRLAELLLPRVDYPSMAASVEARSPFMDHELIEYTASLPWEYKMKDGPKTILKEIAKERLPEYILNAPKVGFGMLLTPFLKDTLPVWFERDILTRDSLLKNFVSSEFLTEIFEEHKNTKEKGYQMWILYSLHKWLQVNFEN